MSKNEAIQNLLAAEAEYLQACGWVPVVKNDKVRWQSPDQNEVLFQSNAVKEQKERDLRPYMGREYSAPWV